MKTLLYLLYGTRETYWRECKFSILSALHFLNQEPDHGIEIMLATDQPSQIEGWPVVIHPIKKETLEGWAGPDNYFHRSKNRVMAEVMDTYQGPTVFVDTDTYFLQSPSKLFERVAPGESVMHLPEGRLVDDHPQLAAYAVGRALPDPEGGTYTISEDSQMFNSGITGLHPSDRPLLDRALWLVDQLYGPTKVFNVEQYGMGEVLHDRTKLHMSGDIIQHYWGFSRAFFHRDMRLFFEKYGQLSVAEQAQHTPEIRAEVPKNTIFERVLDRLNRKLGRWSKTYGAAFLAAKQAQNFMRPGNDEPELAKIWRNQAHALLREEFHNLRNEGDMAAVKSRAEQALKASYFNPFRDPAKLKSLPEDEAKAWADMWQDLRAL
jgi:hypothetical protein